MSNKISGNTKKNLLKKIKAAPVLRIIFLNLRENHLLEIIKYNKNLQKKDDKNLKDFKRIYFEIEIHLSFSKNIFGKFINTIEDKKSIFHIYSNDSMKEIKTNKITKEDKIEKVKIIISGEINSLSNLFKKCKCIKGINFIKMNRKSIKDISGIFDGCASLEEININKLKTDNVENMGNMFRDCIRLNKINLDNLKTGKVENMAYMFCNCSSLKEINLSNFHNDNLTNICGMFMGWESLKKIDLYNFYGKNVLDMRSLFHG